MTATRRVALSFHEYWPRCSNTFAEKLASASDSWPTGGRVEHDEADRVVDRGLSFSHCDLSLRSAFQHVGGGETVARCVLYS